MIVVDTCIWIEFFKCNHPIYDQLKDLLEKGEIIASEFVFAELMQGVKNRRERIIVSEYWQSLKKFPTENLIFNAGLKSSLNKWYAKGVGLIDISILTYAQENNCQLWTIDKKLLGIMQQNDVFTTG
jgi:predicted nucleic acid-binding protein